MYHLASSVMRPGQAALLVGVAHVAPEDRLDLRSRRRRGDHERLARWMHIDPPERQPRHRVRLRNVVRRLEGAVAILDHRLRHAVLARPPELAQGVGDPADRIADVRVLGWVEQISEDCPGRWRGEVKRLQFASISDWW